MSNKYVDNNRRIPDGVSHEEAGPIMCAGVISYTALKRSAVSPGQWIVILGAGDGLGHLGIQYPKAMGMCVIAIHGGKKKRKLCMELGAEAYMDFAQSTDVVPKVTEVTTHGAHGVIVFTGAKAGYDLAPGLLRPRGTMVAVGNPTGIDVVAGAPAVLLSSKRFDVVGSVTGSSQVGGIPTVSRAAVNAN